MALGGQGEIAADSQGLGVRVTPCVSGADGDEQVDAAGGRVDDDVSGAVAQFFCIAARAARPVYRSVRMASHWIPTGAS
ncbi:hypothetical protein GCM10020000_06090 [Streptomyces olivoverticillatus]